MRFAKIMRNLLLIDLKIAKEHAYSLLFCSEVVDDDIFTSLDFGPLLNLSQKGSYNVVVLIIGQ